MRLYPVLSMLKLVALSFLMQAHAQAETVLSENSSQQNFKVQQIAEGLEFPWGMAFLPNNDILVTEREGRLRIIRNGKLAPEAIAGLPKNIRVEGQGGLLDVALHPDFKNNNYVYISYSGKGDDGNGTEIARGTFNGHRLSNVEVIFRVAPKTSSDYHFGGRLQFLADGTLILTTGDKYTHMKDAQSPDNHLGTIVRINDDGSVPSDNPFIGKADAKPEVYSYGHRNVQGIAVDPNNNNLWIHEHGPQGGDEVNLIEPGKNYGWPAITYGIDYSGDIISDKTEAPGMEQPVVYWDPSIAPSGMAYYDGDKFPKWQGNLFVGALAHMHLRRLEMKDNKVVVQEKLLEDLEERIRDVVTGPDGYIYILTDNDEGRVLRLEPAE